MESNQLRRTISPALCLLLVSSALVRLSSAAEPVDYLRHIKPLLATHCYACHGALKQSGSLRLDTAASVLQGGDSGPIINREAPDHSDLLARIVSTDPAVQMPPEGKRLSGAEVELIRSWIESGPLPIADEQPQADPLKHWAFVAPRQMLPQFVSEEPNAGASGYRGPNAGAFGYEGVESGIDAWLSHAQAKLGVQPLPAATKPDLLRRVTLDLVGLPPTPDELHDFLADNAVDAYEKVVDRLLARTEYGERWGRHWMDVWRYSDWYGRRAVPDVMNSYPQIWRWRDWIVRSLNQDKGYDQMVREMIAADELTPNDPTNVVATGYIVRNWYKWNYETWMKDSVEHTGKAFLGLTLNCAMCHDHKFDPISQEDYFRFRAFFEPLELRHDRVSGEPDPGPFKKYVYAESYGPISSGAIRIFDEKLDAQTFMFRGGDARNRIEDHPPVDCGPPRALSDQSFAIQPIALPPQSAYPGLQSFIRQEELTKLEAECAKARLQLEAIKSNTDSALKLTGQWQLQLQVQQASLSLAEAQLECLKHRIAADDAQLQSAGDAQQLAEQASSSEKQVAYLSALQACLAAELSLVQSERQLAQIPTDKADQLEPAKKAVKAATDKLQAARTAVDTTRGKLTVKETQYAALSPKYPTHSTGRRTALANWLTSPTNTLAARVAVNHMWMRHFGTPLVETVDNFGIQGKSPTHPELLDWLAVELVRQNWSMKALHRIIVTSQAYRRSSHIGTADHPNYAMDRDNVALWHFPTRRMEAEVVRDSMLACAGTLDRQVGGPEIPTELGTKTPRRSMYFVQHGEAQMLFLSTFDGANPCECYRRTSTVLPSQALALTNSDLLIHYARICADQLANQIHANKILDISSNSAFVTLAFETCLGREPTKAELNASLEFLDRPAPADVEVAASPPPAEKDAWAIRPPSTDIATRSRENLIMALFNHNDFVTIR